MSVFNENCDVLSYPLTPLIVYCNHDYSVQNILPTFCQQEN